MQRSQLLQQFHLLVLAGNAREETLKELLRSFRFAAFVRHHKSRHRAEMRDQNLSCFVEQFLRDRAGRLARRRFANGATGPIAVRRARALPEEIRALGCVRDGEGEARVELGFIAGCAGGFAYEKACDRPDMLSQPLLRAHQKPRSPNAQPAWSGQPRPRPQARLLRRS